MKVYQDIHKAYKGVLNDVYFNYDSKASPRGLPIREKTDYVFRVMNPVAEAIVTADAERNAKIASYTQKETDLYDSCTNKVEDFARASKFWEKIANPDGTINSAYGFLIWKKKSHGHAYYEDTLNNNGEYLDNGLVDKLDEYRRTPWDWCVHALKADKDTRQAILRFSLPEHFWIGNKDMVCTLHGNFSIRDDKLNFSVVMRSNDLVLGLAYDLPWFVSLMDKMLEDLKTTYPELTKGHYTHVVHNMHIYEKDSATVLKMLGET
jgi:thymidylate synthase